ncbi:MAG TPA: IPT/TIG domain-containing protein, partial [Methanoregula sp.]|nr:IPT/TIG domain-containing protein [Methanoregula sp.]
LNGATGVKFGNTPASTFMVNSDTSITATSPAGSVGSVDVTVTTPGGTSAQNSPYDWFTFNAVPGPAVAGVMPNNGPATGGTIVTISGLNLNGATGVKFGGTPASTFTVNGDTSITATSPAGSVGSVDVTVTTPGGTSAPNSPYDWFTFNAVPGPAVTGVMPNNGPATGGTIVTISGLHLNGATGVKFGSTPASTFTVNGDTSITATTPSGAGTVDVTVTTPGGTSAPNSPYDWFTYEPVGIPVPEFPTVILPVVGIIGFVATVFLIRRIREH